MKLLAYITAAGDARLGELAADGSTVFPLHSPGPVETDGILALLDPEGTVRNVARTGDTFWRSPG